VVPLVLFQALVFTDSLWNWLDLDETWEALLYALLLAAIGNLEIANVPATVMYVFPVAWALLGAIFSRILGFRWGCLILLVLRVIATVVCGVFLLFLIGILGSVPGQLR
jgi:hypothetical protein